MANTQRQLKNEIEEFIINNNLKSELATRDGELFLLMDVEEEEIFGYKLDNIEWGYLDEYVICVCCGEAIHEDEERTEESFRYGKLYTCKKCVEEDEQEN